MPKSMTLGIGLAIKSRDQDVRRFQIPVDDAFLVGVLDGTAHVAKQFEPFVGRQPVAVTVVGDRNPFDQFHDEVGTARFGGATVEDPSNVGVVHHRQGLPLGLEAADHLLGVHARLDDLQGHLAANRLLLDGHEDRAHAAFADLLDQLVGADVGAGLLGDGRIGRWWGRRRRRSPEKIPGIGVGSEKFLDSAPYLGVALASLVKISGTLLVGSRARHSVNIA